MRGDAGRDAGGVDAVALTRAAPQNAQKSRNGGRRYSDEEIEVALSVVAFHCGNTRKAAETLEDQGLHVPESTLRHWRSKLYVERYMEIRGR